MRTLIYARFSSDLQNDRSIDDQIADCRARAAREGWEVVDVFTDYAISGGAGLSEGQRPGMNALIGRVQAGGIGQVLADTSSRIARDLGDFDRLRKLLAFHGARLFSLADGELDGFKGTVKALIDEQQRKDTAHNIRRGQRGRALDKMNPGGMAYGYRKVARFDERGQAILGLREIDPDQAPIVVSIFTWMAEGMSTREICARLNGQGIAAPGGGRWSVATVLGHAQRRNGILRNDLYRGRIIYNRTRKVEHPVSRKKTIRLNPEHEWTIVDAPELRIVDEDLWEAAHARIQRFAGGLRAPVRRARRLLSGKAFCGVCGATWRVLSGTNRFGGRWGCAARHDGRGCTNGRTITNQSFEKRVLKGLSERLLDPELVAAYVEEYRAAWAEEAKKGRKDRTRIERRKADAEARIRRLMESYADGRLDLDSVADMIAGAKAEKARCAAELAELAAEKVIALHPGLVDAYRRRIADLTRALDGDDRHAAREAVRALIDRIVVTPKEPRVTVGKDGTRRKEPTIGTAIEVHGLLSSVVEMAGGKLPNGEKCPVALVPLGRIGRSSTLLKIAC
jgi:DNA invertase Pin-like site-specific DNA recombinase